MLFLRILQKIKIFIPLLLICLAFSLSYSQPPDGGGDMEDPDEGIPIDGGVGFLAAAGIGYGVKKLRDQRKKK